MTRILAPRIYRLLASAELPLRDEEGESNIPHQPTDVYALLAGFNGFNKATYVDAGSEGELEEKWGKYAPLRWCSSYVAPRDQDLWAGAPDRHFPAAEFNQHDKRLCRGPNWQGWVRCCVL